MNKWNEEIFRRKIKELLNFQYGRPVGDFISSQELFFKTSISTGRLKYVYTTNGKLLVSIRPDGYALLEKAALELLQKANVVKKKLIVKKEATGFILRGKDVLVSNVERFVGKFNLGEDVIVANESDLLACGQLVLLPSEVKFFKRGVVVKNRFGVKVGNQNS